MLLPCTGGGKATMTMPMTTMIKQKTARAENFGMGRGERRVAMRYARALIADARGAELSGNSTLAAVGDGYDAALAAARAVCGVTLLGNRRSDLETLLAAAIDLGLDEAWRATAPEQVKRYNRQTRMLCKELPTEADAARTVRWAETIYEAAVTFLGKMDPGLGQRRGG